MAHEDSAVRYLQFMKLGPGSKVIVVLAVAVVVFAGLRMARGLLIPLTLAILVASISIPMIRWLTDRRVPRGVAVTAAVLVDLAVLTGTAVIVGSSVNEFSDELPAYRERFLSLGQQQVQWFDAHGVQIPARIFARVTDVGWVMDLITELLKSLANLLSDTFLVLIFVVFMLFEAGRWRMKVAYSLGDPDADMSRWYKAASEVQSYLVYKTVISFATGVLCFAWVAVVGVDFALLWGLLTFVLNYIPNIGSVIAAGPPVALALVQYGPGKALVVLLGYVGINLVFGWLIEPRVLGRALGLSPLVVLLSMFFWGWLWGPIGALLAVPLTMVLKIILSHTEDLRWMAIFLGSARWVEDSQAEWRARALANQEASNRPSREPVDGSERETRT